jgi:hypothetical protein
MADSNHKKESLSQQTHQTIDVIGADNLADNNAMMADNAPDTEYLLADSITIQAENVPDSMVNEEYSMVSEDDRQTDNNENIEFFDKISILELQKKYNIKRDALYKRMGYLRITTYKVSGKACLCPEQVAQMDGLHEHIRGGHKMDTYPKPEPTGPQKLEIQQTEPLQVLSDVEVENTESAITLQQSNIQQSSYDSKLPDNLEPLGPQAVIPRLNDKELENIDKQAQIIAATRYVATQELADYYASTGEFTIPEIVEGINQRRSKTESLWESTHQASDPKSISQLLINRAKARKAVGIQNQAEVTAS